MDSLFGMLVHIMEKTGLTWNQVMYELSWVTVKMMLADSPKSVKKSELNRKMSGKQLFGILGKK